MDYSFKEIINKKKNEQALDYSELHWIVHAFLDGKLPDYQMTAFLAVLFFKGMLEQEIYDLTDIYVRSGSVYGTKDVAGWKADKHSTGGIGDKITFIFAPLVASYGIKVAKLSGRALGITGGTIDKLESFPNFRSDFDETEFKTKLQKNSICIMSANKLLAPADSKIYALRDVTELVESLPLIAASIMSKKLVIDTDSIVLDVKIGSGAFVKDLDTATKLAKLMIAIGKAHNRKVVVMFTDMNKPLGRAIGNALEVREAIVTLQGNGSTDLVEIASTAVALTLVKAELFPDFETAKADVLKKIATGVALPYLQNMVVDQGGDWTVMENYAHHFTTKNVFEIRSPKTGYLNYHNSQFLGFLAIDLGAGRKVKTDHINYAAGIYLNKVSGEFVEKNQLVMTLYSDHQIQAEHWQKLALGSFEILNEPLNEPLIKKIIE